MQEPKNPKKISLTDQAIRIIYIVLGTIALGIGIIAIFVPVIPTTPFLLIAAACYIRGSKRFYNFLIKTEPFGRYIKDYHEGKGISKRAKTLSLILLWISLIISAVLVSIYNQIILIAFILFVIGVLVTIHILRIKTKENT